MPPRRLSPEGQLSFCATAGSPGLRIHRYVLEGGWIVLAGCTDEDNDRLSLALAHPDDWWFHVRGMPGSHVVLRSRSGEDPPREALRQAAAVAAYHSKARSGGVVAVSVTRARFVSKPRGAKPGTVEVRREEVLKVRPALPEEEGAVSREPNVVSDGDTPRVRRGGRGGADR